MTSICSSLIDDFQDEIGATRKMLEAVPADKLDWKPHDKSMSLGQLAGHIAETPGWARAMMEDVLDVAEMMATFEPFVASSTSELMAKWDSDSKQLQELLEGKDDAFAEATWTMRAGDKELLAVPRHKALREHVLHHLVHHRGQLSVYLRLIGVPVPNTYGPTADYPMSMG